MESSLEAMPDLCTTCQDLTLLVKMLQNNVTLKVGGLRCELDLICILTPLAQAPALQLE